MKVIVDRLTNSDQEPIEVEEIFGTNGSIVKIKCNQDEIVLDNKNDYELENLIRALQFFRPEY